jgi:hypothetical protein
VDGPYYVGLTSRAPLGDRLKQHLSDYHEDRWERFSWFGFRAVSSARLADGTSALRALPKAPRADSRSAIADIEALLIQSLGTHHRGNAHQVMRAAQYCTGIGNRKVHHLRRR